MNIRHSKTISLDCPYCLTKCQFTEIDSYSTCNKVGNLFQYSCYLCTHCEGKVVTEWVNDGLCGYSPSIGSYKSKIDLNVITNDKVKKDFTEAISCYNNKLYNACMIMARRAIQQEVLAIVIKNEDTKESDNLYKQIESTGISEQLKELLHKIKNFGNYGAHPDFCLFDNNGNEIEDEENFSKLSLEFLDRYLADQYEINSLVEGAPKTKHELKK